MFALILRVMWGTHRVCSIWIVRTQCVMHVSHSPSKSKREESVCTAFNRAIVLSRKIAKLMHHLRTSTPQFCRLYIFASHNRWLMIGIALFCILFAHPNRPNSLPLSLSPCVCVCRNQSQSRTRENNFFAGTFQLLWIALSSPSSMTIAVVLIAENNMCALTLWPIVKRLS